MAERSWYLALDGRQEGPFPESQLSALIAAGRLTRDTLVWSEGMSGWQKAGEIPGFVFSAQAPPPYSAPLPGSAAWPAAARPAGIPFSSDFDVWGLFGRYLVLALGSLVVFWAPWAFISCYRWLISHIKIPEWPNLTLEGKLADIWYVFVLIVLCSYVNAASGRYRFIALLVILAQAALSWMALRWVVGNLSSEGRPLGLTFNGNILTYIGWNLLLILSILTIVGWAWVITAWTRWVCAHIAGTPRAIAFNASGLEVLWRVVVTVLASIFIIPAPWMLYWYVRWMISQFSIEPKAA